jgi:hypothetical protein
MAGKPTSLSAILQEGLPKMAPPSGIPLRNRFNVLKDRSVSASSRSDSRSESQKRIRVESPEPVDRNHAFRSMEAEEERFKMAKSLVDKVKEGVKGAKEKGMEGPIWAILQHISEWMEITTGVQETTANVVVDSYNKVASPTRKSRRDSPGKKGKEKEVLSEEESELQAKKKKFAQEVKEAERSTLIFRTNMGTTPVLNPETMKRRFTENVIAKAAAVEGKEGRPSQAVTEQLDDALAMVTKMDFFGKQTKKSKDKHGNEEDFCTIPVKLSFKDKETREAADNRLKKLCKMGGTVPYHRTLRNVINTVLDECKQKFPDSYIQVKVDVQNFQLKISRLSGGVWLNNVDKVDLPESVLDLSRMGAKVVRSRKEDGEKASERSDNEVSEMLQG